MQRARETLLTVCLNGIMMTKARQSFASASRACRVFAVVFIALLSVKLTALFVTNNATGVGHTSVGDWIVYGENA